MGIAKVRAPQEADVFVSQVHGAAPVHMVFSAWNYRQHCFSYSLGGRMETHMC